MNYSLLWNTVRHLKGRQLLFQVFYRVHKPKYKACCLSPAAYEAAQRHRLHTAPIPRWHSCDGQDFTFLNLKHKFAGWNFTDNGMLWAYNQNYFDFINQEEIDTDTACVWIDKFIEELPQNRVGLDPYPIALRTFNWVKFFCQHPETVTKERTDCLYSQYLLLQKKLEYHLLGNHLLEDAFSIYAVGIYFQDIALAGTGERLLRKELQEQILPDGAHYEQSPMYHCILLDRLLDVYNITQATWLTPYASKMLGHLERICYHNQTWPFFNDAALGIAPTPEAIKDYAKRLGIDWKAIPLRECGYRYLCNNHMEAFVDVGGITASYQPGHSHADTCNYELRIDGKPFVVDTGISTYDKTARRQYERSTAAHNCVTVNGQDSDEVWGGFRVGRRCRASVLNETQTEIRIAHNGFPKSYTRTFKMLDDKFVVDDYYEGNAISYIHLAEGADKKRITIEGATSVEEVTEKVSVEYNKFLPCQVLKIHFNGHLTYRIQTPVSIE